jgi:hypothetical protein
MSPLKIPGNVTVRELGVSENHDRLSEVISNYAFGKFWVTNEDEEKKLRAVRCAFDDGVDTDGWGVLHVLLQDGDHETQIRLLLALGIDPDKPTNTKYRASHHTTFYGRPSCARALAPCRPDVTARDGNGYTPSTMRSVGDQS